MFAKTFIKATRLPTTTRNGLLMHEVHRRTIRSLSTGKVVDDCIVDNIKDSELNRRLNIPDDIRVELTMKGALHIWIRLQRRVGDIVTTTHRARSRSENIRWNEDRARVES